MKKYSNLSYEEFDFLNPRIRGKYFVDSNSAEYISWLCMLQRCYSKKNTAYKDYGGRGIKVCERWLGFDGFNNFYEDMKEKPDKHSLDRIDNNGMYSLENCRWATQKQQVRNTRIVKKLEINGITRPIVEWAEIFCLDYNLVRNRIKRGWDPKDALFIVKNGLELMPGEVFSDWTVIEKNGPDYRCKCVCGNISLVGKFELVNELSKRCRSCANTISAFNQYENLMDEVWYVYIVLCSDDTLYAGITNNLDRRIKQHNESNMGAKYTRSRRPVKLLKYFERQNKSEALILEYKIKQMSREEKLQYHEPQKENLPETSGDHD